VSFVEEVIVPFRVPRDQVPMGTHFKSTWLSASLEIMRERRLMEPYLEKLPKQFHDPILHSIAGVWLPAEVIVEHYRACDQLGLSLPEQVAGGKAILNRLQKTIFSMGFRAAREAGVTPFNVLKQLPANWDREWKGGGVGIFKIGPKDARVEMLGFAGAAIPYCRNGLRGVVMGLCELVCTKAYAQEIRELCTPTSVAFRVAWA
jgi:hypothetical protein